MSSRQLTDRRSQYKNTVGQEDGRRRREDISVSIRKNKREEGLAKRRQMSVADDSSAGSSVINASTGKSGRTFTVADIPQLRVNIQSNDPAVRLDAVKGFRKVLSLERNPPVKDVVETGILPILIQLLQCNDSSELQFESAWALTNIASTDMTRCVVDSGAVPIMAQLLLSPCPDVREQCAWCLSNIAGDCPELRDFVIMSGAMHPLLQNVMQPATNSMLRNAVWALSNFCRGKPQPKLETVAPALPVLAETLKHHDKEVLMDCCWALSYLSDGEDARVEAVVRTNICPRLVQLLSHESCSVTTPALRTIGNIASGSDSQTQAIVDAGALNAVLPLLEHTKRGIRKEACWMLSNVAAGSQGQLSSLMAIPQIVTSVIAALANSEWEVQKEAAWVISNIATGGTKEQASQLLINHTGAIEAMCCILNVQDSKMVIVALDAVDALLQCGASSGGVVDVPSLVDECGGLDSLENLQNHENEEIYNKAVKIIETYFGGEESDVVDTENVDPRATQDGKTFSFGAQNDGIAQTQIQPFGLNNFQLRT